MSTKQTKPGNWKRDERSRLIGYIFGLLDAVPHRLVRCVGLEDGIEFASPWSGEIWVLRFELAPMVNSPQEPDDNSKEDPNA